MLDTKYVSTTCWHLAKINLEEIYFWNYWRVSWRTKKRVSTKVKILYKNQEKVSNRRSRKKPRYVLVQWNPRLRVTHQRLSGIVANLTNCHYLASLESSSVLNGKSWLKSCPRFERSWVILCQILNRCLSIYFSKQNQLSMKTMPKSCQVLDNINSHLVNSKKKDVIKT